MLDRKLILFLVLCGSSLKQAAAASNRTFPDYFKFGVATASYQVEGAWNEDGKGENIWDHICHTDPTFVVNSDNGDVACDSYHKYEEDVQNLVSLGVDYYRLSISWSRILPMGLAGTPINQAGIDYYRNLLEELIANDIEPLVTIFHWDLPEPLQEMGGFPNPELEDHYVNYARIVFEQFGDLVQNWITFNEPLQICQQGYGRGTMAPGYLSSGLADYKCGHTLIKAHARTYHMYDEEFRSEQHGKIGLVGDLTWYQPATGSDEDLEASEIALQFMYGWFANPIFNGNYPQVMIDRVDARSALQGFQISRLPKFTEEEIDYIKGTHDFLGLNVYSSLYIQARSEEYDLSVVSYESDQNVETWVDVDWEESASSWLKVVPWGARKVLNWVKQTYNDPEIYITENGFTDRGGLEDDRRINYIREYLSNILDAVLDDGVNVTRYTCWSLMDNLEWNRGYSEKFGLYSVDFSDPDRPRTPKASAAFFTQVTSTKCLVDVCE